MTLLKKKVALLVCCVLAIIPNTVIAQLFPNEGDTLNYRLAGFSALPHDKAVRYRFEIADPDAPLVNFQPAVIASTLADTYRAIITLPAFNKSYLWRVSYIGKRNKLIASTPYISFSTGYYPSIDSNLFRLKILDSANHHHDVFFIVDYTAVIYDINGSPVWSLPGISLAHDKTLNVRDIKSTNDGTFTATSNHTAYEFDYNGKIIWQAPDDGKVNGDTSEYYHHEFTKLSSGNYMVAGMQHILLEVPKEKLTEIQKQSDLFEIRNGRFYRRIPTDNLIEYNSKKEVVWSWKAADHFGEQDFFRSGDYTAFGLSLDLHLNSFYFDEKERVIYISFRNLNQVIKIEYPSGRIIRRYGAVWLNDGTKDEDSLFYGQHCVFKKDEKIYLFNNNTNKKGMITDSTKWNNISHVSIFNENDTKTGLHKSWDISCDIDTQTSWHGGAGGSVAPMDDGCILVSMGSAGRIFIVDKNKRIVWNTIPQGADGGRNWYTIGPYRVNFINKSELEKIIMVPLNRNP